ncbi:MAG: SpoIIE family protein phosphatase [Phycisphaera sp.]|nr:SpoIIE family protein phosphatase [Phycisphaera sp.]
MPAAPDITQDAHTHTMRCMEVWGSNRAEQTGVSVPGIDAFIYSEPHNRSEGGGDIHYVSSCAAGKISRFAVADVSGHGVDVDELATKLRRLVRKHINTPDQTRFARALNEEFASLAQVGRFATAILATYFTPTDHLIVVNAGHPRPLWYRAESNHWQHLDGDCPGCEGEVGNLPLGIIEPTDYRQVAVKLAPGDIVVIYTDAMMEAMDDAGNQLGEEGLLELVRSIRSDDPARLATQIIRAVEVHRGHRPSDDDQTVLVLHHNAHEPAKQNLGEKLRVLAKMMGL